MTEAGLHLCRTAGRLCIHAMLRRSASSSLPQRETTTDCNTLFQDSVLWYAPTPQHAGTWQDTHLEWPTGMQTCWGSGMELGPSDPELEGRQDTEQL